MDHWTNQWWTDTYSLFLASLSTFYIYVFLFNFNFYFITTTIQVARSNRVNFQTFFDLMQQSAEDLDLMDLEDAMLDNMLPLVILKTFLNDFLVGVSRMQVGASAAVKRSSRLEEQKEMKEIET